MIIKKIGIITGNPYNDSAMGAILLIDERSKHFWLKDSAWLLEQSNDSDSTGENGSYRKATESEIARHWENIAKHWDPQPGDEVVITQPGYTGYGVVLNPDSNGEYWRVTEADGNITPFTKLQMMLSREHGWTIMTEKPAINPDKFSKYHPNVVDELRKLDIGLVDLLTSRLEHDVYNISHVSDVIGGGFGWVSSPEGIEFWSGIQGDIFRKDYDSANKRFYDLNKTSEQPESKNPKPRWKVGDFVTYKHHKDLPDQKYRFGGVDQEGLVRKITHYGEFIKEHNCYKIEVESNYSFSFEMLESEFQEWDSPKIKPEESTSFKKDERFSDIVWKEAESNLEEGLWELIQQRVVNDIASSVTNLSKVVWAGFTWGETKEGHFFWAKIGGFLASEDYSRANQYYNDYIQQVKQATELEPKTVVSNFEIGETVLVNEPAMDAYKAKIVGMSPLHVEIEVDLKDYPLKIKIDSHVLRKYVQHSCIAKFPVESINLEESVSKKEPSSDLKFKLRDRVIVTEGVGKGKTGVITKLPSKDPMYFVLLDTSESLWKYSQNIKLVSEEERAQKVDLELLRSKFPRGSKVMITKGVHKDCFGTVKHHKIGYVDGPLVGVEVNKYISGTNLDGTIDTTNGWYVTENELVHSSWYSSPESPSEVLSIVQPKKDLKISDYQQKPINLYKSNNKTKLKPINI